MSTATTKESTRATESGPATVAGEKQLVIFTLGKENYGVDIGTVREIIGMQTITKVPRTAEFIEGVINLRGKVIPIIDLRKRFGLIIGDETPDMRIVVIDIGGQNIGVIVDAVTEVLRIPGDCVEPPSSVIGGQDCDDLVGIAKLESRLIILLDLKKVLSGGDKKQIAGLMKAV